MLRAIRDGLSRGQKELPARFFYDRLGSELFERITELPEYYLTRSERWLLQRWMPAWVPRIRPAALVELGAGSAEKTRLVLDQIVASHPSPLYVPVDVSAEFLAAAAARLAQEYPTLRVRPAIADISGEFELADGLPRPVLVAFLGSTIGNFATDEALRLLRAVSRAMRPGDRFLLGVDLRKDASVLEAAYNDSAGITAEFNRNILGVLNREAGADFDLAAFAHRAFYDRELHRIEMHLVARSDQRVTVPGAGSWPIAAGESIRTEISCKHDRASAAALLHGSGMRIQQWETDTRSHYAVVLAGTDS